jgi:hypothetical protein
MNNMVEALRLISQLEKSIFSYNKKDIIDNSEHLISNIIVLSQELNDKQKEIFSEIIKYINIALANQDLLFFADILTYELKPLVEGSLDQ